MTASDDAVEAGAPAPAGEGESRQPVVDAPAALDAGVEPEAPMAAELDSGSSGALVAGAAAADTRVEVGAPEAAELEVAVSLLSGAELGRFRLPENGTVLELKQRLEGSAELQLADTHSIKLLWGTQVLPDEATLVASGIPNGALLHVVRTPRKNILAVMRIRPTVGDEANPVVVVDPKSAVTVVRRQDGQEGRDRDWEVQLDAVYDQESTQAEVFDSCARGLVDGVLDGYNATILAYGPSGTGKRHTLFGSSNLLTELLQGGDGGSGAAGHFSRAPSEADEGGILFRAFDRLAAGLEVLPLARAKASFLQLVRERAWDLLAEGEDGRLIERRVRQTRGGAVFADGAVERGVRSAAEMRGAFLDGWRRHTESCRREGDRSRWSHLLLSVEVEVREPRPEGWLVRSGKLTVGKLAGSERPPRPSLLSEGLSSRVPNMAALLHVLSALQPQPQPGRRRLVPYRDSKLTHLLRESLGGNARTLIIGTCEPSEKHAEEAISTLRVLSRARRAVNHPRPNEATELGEGPACGASLSAAG